MVPWRRLELPQPCGYTPLKRARLPIPPLRRHHIFSVFLEVTPIISKEFVRRLCICDFEMTHGA